VLKPRLAATESRLAVVMHQLTRLAEESDSNPKTRLAALMAERERIDREIQAVCSAARRRRCRTTERWNGYGKSLPLLIEFDGRLSAGYVATLTN